VKTSARINDVLAAGMTIVVIVVFRVCDPIFAGLARIWGGFLFAAVLRSGPFNLNSIFTALPSRY